MLSTKECQEKIDELNEMIRRYTAFSQYSEYDMGHYERLRRAYTVEMSKSLERSGKK